MKAGITILIFIILSSCNVLKAQVDSLPKNDPLILQIKSMNFSSYVGGTVNSFFSQLPSGYTDVKITGSVVLKRARYLAVEYAKHTVVVIAVDEFTHMNPERINSSNPQQNWDINQFKQEKIAFIVAFNGLCFHGCENLIKVQ